MPPPDDHPRATSGSAISRALAGIEKHIELTVDGRPPVKRAGFACRWCPLNKSCTDGLAFLDRDADETDVVDVEA